MCCFTADATPIEISDSDSEASMPNKRANHCRRRRADVAPSVADSDVRGARQSVSSDELDDLPDLEEDANTEKALVTTLKNQKHSGDVMQSDDGRDANDLDDVIRDLDTRWSCVACTFDNHADLPFCEMCSTPKAGGKRTVRRSANEKNSDADDDFMSSARRRRRRHRHNKSKSVKRKLCTFSDTSDDGSGDDGGRSVAATKQSLSKSKQCLTESSSQTAKLNSSQTTVLPVDYCLGLNSIGRITPASNMHKTSRHDRDSSQVVDSTDLEAESVSSYHIKSKPKSRRADHEISDSELSEVTDCSTASQASRAGSDADDVIINGKRHDDSVIFDSDDVDDMSQQSLEDIAEYVSDSDFEAPCDADIGSESNPLQNEHEFNGMQSGIERQNSPETKEDGMATAIDIRERCDESDCSTPKTHRLKKRVDSASQCDVSADDIEADVIRQELIAAEELLSPSKRYHGASVVNSDELYPWRCITCDYVNEKENDDCEACLESRPVDDAPAGA